MYYTYLRVIEVSAANINKHTVKYADLKPKDNYFSAFKHALTCELPRTRLLTIPSGTRDGIRPFFLKPNRPNEVNLCISLAIKNLYSLTKPINTDFILILLSSYYDITCMQLYHWFLIELSLVGFDMFFLNIDNIGFGNDMTLARTQPLLEHH